MKKINTSPISGMQELLPSSQAVFNNLKNGIAEVFYLYGFQNIETPVIDRNEILFAKAGGDTEKQIYRVVKTTEEIEDSTESLRFDHTVPLARYIAEHESNLNFPFRVSQIGRNFRGERAQKGRFREFYQCDVDVIGRNELSLSYDAEVIATLFAALKTFELPAVKFRINNRKFLSGILGSLGLAEKSAEIYNIIDHAEKVPAERTVEALQELGLSEESVVKITTLINTHGAVSDLKNLDFLDFSNPQIAEGFAELEFVMHKLDGLSLSAVSEIDLKIVRGLDYYTGTVFETVIPGYEYIGSICSGGRYENLASNYTDQKFPGVGGSIGLTRLFYVLGEANLIKEDASAPIDFAIIPIDESAVGTAQEIAKLFRDSKQSADVILSGKKLGDMLKHASKIAKHGIIIGETEIETGVCKIKRFSDGLETELKYR